MKLETGPTDYNKWFRMKAVKADGSFESVEGGFRCGTDHGPLEVTAHAPGILRLRFHDADAPDYGLVADREDVADVKVEEIGEDGNRTLTLRAGNISVTLETSPLCFTFEKEGKKLIEPSEDSHFVNRFRLPPFSRTDAGWFFSTGLKEEEPVYGGGEKYATLNRRGQLVDNWNHDALGVNADLCYKNCPFFWSPEGWGLFINTPSRVMHGVGYTQWSHQSYAAHVEDSNLDIFLIQGDTPAAILERYTALTGRAPEVPLWSLGAWICRAYYKTQEEAMDMAEKLREREIPCDVFTLDGRAWLDTDTRFGFEWDASRYPDPTAFTKPLKEMGYKLCNWEYPIISEQHPLFRELEEKGWLLKDENGGTYLFEFDSEPFGEVLTQLPKSGLFDFTAPGASEWWGKAHNALFEAGVDCMKTDFGEQIEDGCVAYNGDKGRRLHNVYPLLYNRCVYEATGDYHGRENALVWGRAGWAGSQTAAVQWAGDSQVSWGGLSSSIRGGLSWGLCGVPYYSHDIGGFYGGDPDDELYIRWVQAGMFFSHARFHGIGRREPVCFKEETESIVREWLHLRYRLLPYLQRACAQAHRTGMPVQRAMVAAFPEDRIARGFENQFMLGDDILVAPVVTPGGKVSCWLPEGVWYDFWTNERLEGGRILDIECPLEKAPVFVREGALIAFGPVVQYTGELNGRYAEKLVAYGMPRGNACCCDPRLSLEGGESRMTVSGLDSDAVLETVGDVSIRKESGTVIIESK